MIGEEIQVEDLPQSMLATGDYSHMWVSWTEVANFKRDEHIDRCVRGFRVGMY